MNNLQDQLKRRASLVSKKIRDSIENKSHFSHPFQHIIIKNLFPLNFAEDLLNAFPDSDHECWQKTNDEGLEVKARTNWASEFDIPNVIIDAVRIFNSAPVLNAMSETLKIPKLMPDPYFTGGGLNLSEKNGHLDVHIDGNYHDASGMNRRVNLLYYLNPNWEKSWGGEFGIYDKHGENLIKSVEPLHNLCIIFDTHDNSFHGLPNPINFPVNDPRRSIILYYYTVSPRPNSQVVVKEPHSALWKSKSFTDKKGNKTREFK